MRRTRGGGLMEEDSWRRTHGGESIEASGSIRKATGLIWHPEGIQETRRRRGQKSLGSKVSQIIKALPSEMKKATIPRGRDRPDHHQVRSLRTKVAVQKGEIVQFRRHQFRRYTTRTPTAETDWGMYTYSIYTLLLNRKQNMFVMHLS